MDWVERVWLQAEQVFGDKAKAAVWLSLSRTTFDGCSALELAREEAGYQRVVEELQRIEHGYAC
ncbi:MbcA/ParS/Xre antitoxin family protein [Pseudomonas donghuensis]|uniref:MbcA/ParS/Xre antitoxin family protein n=1 Tax=Pseudomonas donghuensis TaxID=1163398 RepID=UPI0020C471ED|nr:MbcA/ParS/Xre antitoxin family protein [Pseudomonas donghuensis]MCP6699360.1 MbcA/ParS/Xre antitoxin family protein [Pseudomonas donghuensis]